MLGIAIVLVLLVAVLAARCFGFGGNDRIDDQCEFNRLRATWKAGRAGPMAPVIFTARVR
ncbi:hypothetical protein VT84_30760 [Gemmata sp. SH-PL17]|uniref:hypothetical protein n=1 Tax=Gemmata sp. SH-PL17 TaxID=1630693 RepID=UPI00078D0C39|nr:hypothetical protein [Gemmata sp. SH-PL17]AMV28815.1 hypothetical protein VT84_30760 [Gemmata sp. SH-PL17]